VPEGTKRLIVERSIRIFGRSELARAIGVSESSLEEWKAGISPLPDAQLLKIADLLADRAAKL
jgi:transcriptional regulator with XRE-family HTH domain